MIGVFSGLHHGLGVGLGSLIGGYVYACLGAKSSFRVCAALPTISLLLLALPASLRFVHVGGGNGRNGEGRDGQGLEGWDGAESVGVVLVSTAIMHVYTKFFDVFRRELRAKERAYPRVHYTGFCRHACTRDSVPHGTRK